MLVVSAIKEKGPPVAMPSGNLLRLGAFEIIQMYEYLDAPGANKKAIAEHFGISVQVIRDRYIPFRAAIEQAARAAVAKQKEKKR